MMTQSLNGSRKRVRGNRDEEGTELPLSKRIHNLRINNGNCHNLDLLGRPKHPQSNEEGDLQNGDRWSTQEAGPSDGSRQQQEGTHERLDAQAQQHSRQYLANSVEASNNPDSWATLPRYSPDLDASANPFYYDNNRLLYDLYVERMQRYGMI